MNFFSTRKYKPLNRTILSEYNAFRAKNHTSKLCHAPFRALRFSQSGNIIACCFNRGYILGKYPENSIHDIWFGNKLEELRENIHHNDLSLGCTECSRRIENRLFNLAGAFQYDYLSSYPKSKYPVMLDFEISNICNLECVMCLGENSSSIRKNRDHLPPCQQHYDLHFIEQLKEFVPYLNEARFSGGEPFLIPLYYDIWEMMIQINPNITISILTNATILSDKIKNLLSKGNFRISVSCDSLQKDTYEKIRLNGNFDETSKNLEYFYSYSKTKKTGFNLNVCPMRYNWAEIPSIVRYCNERNIILVLHTVVFPPSESLWASGSNYLKKVLITLENESFEGSSPENKQNLITFNHFIHQIKDWISESLIFEERKKELLEKTESDLLQMLKLHMLHPSDDHSTLIESLLYKSDLNEKERRTIIINLLRFSPDLIISEFAHSEPEKLMLRMKMFNYNAS